MLYDAKQVGEREGLYTVIGALVLAIVLFALLAAYELTGAKRVMCSAMQEAKASSGIEHKSEILRTAARRSFFLSWPPNPRLQVPPVRHMVNR
jgi:hypothetical protein